MKRLNPAGLKVVCAALAFCMALIAGNTALAQVGEPNETVDRDLLYSQVWDKYIQLEEFQMHLEYDPDGAKAMIEDIVDAEIRNANRQKPDQMQPMAGNDGIGAIISPMFEQSKWYYCGPASALTAIYGMGKADEVAGSTYAAKQDTLGANMGTTPDLPDRGTLVWRMRDELNKYVVNGMRYAYHESPSKDTLMWGMIEGAIFDNAAILHADTAGLEYYAGYSTGHYVTVVFANIWNEPDDKDYVVMDNWNSDEHDSYGRHAISLNEAYAATRGRFFICP